MTRWAQGAAGSSAPGPRSLIKPGWRTDSRVLPLFVWCLELLWALPTESSGRWDLGKALGTMTHMIPSLYFDGEKKKTQEVKAGKIFHYIKRTTKKETGAQWPLARPQECASPGNWPLASLLRACWLGKTSALDAAKNADNGLLDLSLWKVRLFVLLSLKVTFIGHLHRHAKR